MNKPRVGVIGLGSMGGGVAKSLLRAGFPVRVCDVRPEVVQSLVDAGAVACASPAELGARLRRRHRAGGQRRADRDGAVRRAAARRRPCARAACSLMSVTVPPDYAERLGPRLAERGILMIDGPVSGGEAKAATGEMTMMAAGAAEAFAQCEPVLGAMADEGLPPGRGAGHGLEGEDDQPAAGRRAHRRRRRGDGARHQGGRRPEGALRCDHQQRRQLLDVPEPGGAHPRRRLHAALGGRHLRQGPGHRARGRQEIDVPAAPRAHGAPDVPAWRRRPATAARTTRP